MTVDIDTDAWADEYGIDAPSQIRADVKMYIESTVRQQLDSLGVLS